MGRINRDEENDFEMYPEFESEKAERRYHATIWWLFTLIGVGFLISLIVNQINENKIAATYNVIEAEYESRELHKTFYMTQQGIKRYYFVPEYKIRENDGKALLYYEDDPAYIRTLPIPEYWLPYYVFFAVIGALGIYKLCKIYCGKKAEPSVELTEEEKRWEKMGM